MVNAVYQLDTWAVEREKGRKLLYNFVLFVHNIQIN